MVSQIYEQIASDSCSVCKLYHVKGRRRDDGEREGEIETEGERWEVEREREREGGKRERGREEKEEEKGYVSKIVNCVI